MTATACCTRKSVVYQIQLRTTRAQISSILSRTSSPTATTIRSLNDVSSSVKLTNQFIKNDINNNPDQQINNDLADETVNDINEEEFLSYVGLRRKTKPKRLPIRAHRPLAKRLAAPICLLPLPHNLDRVRQALYILLPFMKFLSINTDLDRYCSSNEQIFTTNLQLRTAKPIINKPTKRKMSKEEFLLMVANTFRYPTQKTPMTKYIRSTIQCQVVVDRLDELMLNKLMTIGSSKSTLEKTLIKHQSPMTTTFVPMHKAKRLKIFDNHNLDDKYRRIYLKCFVCSKREFIQGETTQSDILHSHWLEHSNDLLLNIYDSEIEQILTRVVEFFSFPRRHVLEGKIQTVFILNSKEIRKTPLKPFDDDDCIILD